MAIWVLYKRFKNIYGPEQNDNTITQNMIKIKVFVPGKVLRSLSSSLLTLRCCCYCASLSLRLCLCSDGYVLRFDRKRFRVLTASVVFFCTDDDSPMLRSFEILS